MACRLRHGADRLWRGRPVPIDSARNREGEVMAGHTGKMTAQEIRTRGPRMWLLEMYSRHNYHQRVGFTIASDRQVHIINCSLGFYKVYARSYSLRYLLGLA